MKNYKLLTAVFFILAMVSCKQDDANINNEYDNVNGQTGIGFRVSNSSVSVPVEGTSIQIPVQVTTVSDAVRNFTVSVDDELSTGVSGDYTIGSIEIPAGEYDGNLDLSFVDTNLVDLIAYDLVLKIDAAGLAIVGEETVTVQYNKTVVCNDYELSITLDNYGSENTWDIVDATGAIVQSGGPYSDGVGGNIINEAFTLVDGCYTFTIYDSYGDGLFDGVNTGTYELTCSILNAASGEGNFGSEAITEFCVNQ
jgi:hypothetical protein